jgi:Biotin/lipoate A/B protein ligase family
MPAPLPRAFEMPARVKPAVELNLPPPFRSVALREAGDAFLHAARIAGTAGPGTFVHVGRFDLAEFAVVLEPEFSLREARRTIYGGLVAIAEALAASAPPEKSIAFTWPDCIHVDRGLVGGARLAWPVEAQEHSPPRWLVFGAMIRTAHLDDGKAGLHPFSTSLDAEGFDTDSGRLFENFTRHFMAVLDTWQQDGFSDIARRYLQRLSPTTSAPRSFDESGNLVLGAPAGPNVKRRSLAAALSQASWFDITTGSPRY